MPVWSQFVDLIEAGLSTFADWTGSAGLAIILFTILIKTLLLPLTVKAVRSTASMQELQPKIKELQKRYGKDRQRLSAETMKLYSEHGVSPAAGCLPMLLQIPIFFGLYFAIRSLSDSGTGVWGEGFLWLPNLAEADPYKVLPILAGIFQFIQTKMSRPAGQGKSADPQQQMMYTMMTFMPLMVVIFGWTFASGPVLYWVTQAVYSVIQQYFITGWGSLLDWLPFLPNLPEHRRLGYQSPEQRAAKAKKSQGGIMGAMQRQVEKQQERVLQSQSQSDDADEDEQDDDGAAQKRQRKAGSRNGRPSQRQPNARPDPNLVPRRSRSSKGKGSIESN